MQTGRVKFYNESIGFGFIKMHDTREPIEIFVHKTDMEDDIKIGDHVKFEIENDDRGLSAVNVMLAKEPQS